MLLPGTGFRGMRRAGALLLLACLPALPAVAQETPDTTAADGLEVLLEDLDDLAADPAQLAEGLADLRDHPLDVNAAAAEDLAQIPALGPSLARAIVRFRTAGGPFGAVADLRAVEGVTDDVLLAARPYLRVGAEGEQARRPGGLLRGLQVELIQRAGRRLDVGRGYDDDTTRTTYAGSPDRLYTRLRTRARRLSFNLTLEKDPGERLAWDPARRTYGFDYVSAHLALRGAGRIEALIVGDYVADFGQGVVLWRSSAFGKGREPVRTAARAGRGLLPYGSTDENTFLRGVAATVLVAPRLAVSAFASRRTLDAGVLEPDTTTGAAFEDLGEATALARSGLHRTPSELGKKDALREDLVGGALEYRSEGARLGVVGYHSRFDRPFRPGEAPYQRFRFAGRRATMAGIYAGVFAGAAHLFGEAARAPGGATGGVGGVVLRLGRSAEAVVLARSYPRDFVSLHGYAFGERSGAPQNETGYYAGLQIHPHPRWHLAAYFDQYRFPWVRFAVPRPSTGYDALLLVEHRPRHWLTVYLQARTETREAGASWTDARGRRLDAVRPETRQSLRLHGDYRFSPRLRLRARIEGVRFAVPGAPDRFGMVLYQDAHWLPAAALRLALRLTLFDADGFDARVFTYEDDLRYTFSVPAFSGRGQRVYVLARWHPSGRFTLEAKAALTRFEDVRSVGSGLDEVAGNRLREVRAQLRWRF